jgi:hypothetical protein
VKQQESKSASLQYLGVDGSVWELDEESSKVQRSGAGLTGVNTALRNIRFSQTANSDGRRRTSFVREARDGMGLTVTLNPNCEPNRLEEIGDAWWKAWSPVRPGRLIYWRPSGEPRTLFVYHDGDAPGEDPILDPFGVLNSFELTMRISADDPVCYGEAIEIGPFLGVRRSIYTSTNAAGEEVGPPFNLYDDENEGLRDVRNVGELPAWPVWTIEGPVSSYSFTIGDETLAGALEVPEGSTLTIDTRKGAKSAHMLTGGVRTLVTDEALTAWGFAPLPPGDSVARILFEGTGTVRGDAVAGYERMW